MRAKVIYVMFGVLALLVFWSSSSFWTRTTAVAVVDSQKVLEGYKAFEEAKNSYELQIKKLSKGFNDKRKIFDAKTQEYEALQPGLSKKERSDWEADLSRMQQELIQLGSQMEDRSAMEEEKLLNGVYNKINDFLDRYGKARGYDVIFGANGKGNIMYVGNGTDITEDVIDALNKEFTDGIQQ